MGDLHFNKGEHQSVASSTLTAKADLKLQAEILDELQKEDPPEKVELEESIQDDKEDLDDVDKV